VDKAKNILPEKPENAVLSSGDGWKKTSKTTAFSK